MRNIQICQEADRCGREHEVTHVAVPEAKPVAAPEAKRVRVPYL